MTTLTGAQIEKTLNGLGIVSMAALPGDRLRFQFDTGFTTDVSVSTPDGVDPLQWALIQAAYARVMGQPDTLPPLFRSTPAAVQ